MRHLSVFAVTGAAVAAAGALALPASAATQSTSPSPSSPATATSTPVEVTGRVTAGVESGCRLLVPDSGSRSSTPYLLLGGDRSTLTTNAHVKVSGVVRSDVISYCMQGTPLQVIEAHQL